MSEAVFRPRPRRLAPGKGDFPDRAPGRLPGLLWLILGTTLLACVLGESRFFGYNTKGWMWVLPLLASIFSLMQSGRRVSFPVWVWAPWVGLLLVYLAGGPAFPNAVQRTAIMLTPVVVGVAVSRLAVTRETLRELLRRVQQFGALLFVLILGQVGVLTTATLPDYTALAPQAMTACLVAVVCAAAHAHGLRRALFGWILMALLPLVALTRTAAAVTLLTLPATFAPLALRKRLLSACAVALVVLAAFSTERFQKKMFYSGEGELSEITVESDDFQDSGRFDLWDRMFRQIERKPLFGHGLNAQEDFIYHALMVRGQPHNDWLRLLFDIGYVGAALFALTLLVQTGLLLRTAFREPALSKEARIFSAAAAWGFVAFALIMVTDNIILYSSFYGNLQFAILGAALAAARRERATGAALPGSAAKEALRGTTALRGWGRRRIVRPIAGRSPWR